jgi:hypothetical protein
MSGKPPVARLRKAECVSSTHVIDMRQHIVESEVD